MRLNQKSARLHKVYRMQRGLLNIAPAGKQLHIPVLVFPSKSQRHDMVEMEIITKFCTAASAFPFLQCQQSLNQVFRKRTAYRFLSGSPCLPLDSACVWMILAPFLMMLCVFFNIGRIPSRRIFLFLARISDKPCFTSGSFLLSILGVILSTIDFRTFRAMPRVEIETAFNARFHNNIVSH